MSNSRVTADFTELLEQGAITAEHYMRLAVKSIDARFGEGYAKDNPELVVGFMRAATDDLSAAVLAKTIPDALDEIAYSVSKVAEHLSYN